MRLLRFASAEAQVSDERTLKMASPNPFDQQRPIPGVSRVIAISSGKGGVGKSTVATNLALALAKTGARVGLLDADIYGPSIPRMLGSLHQKVEIGEDKRIIPLERFKIKLMSIGFLVDEDLAIVWRGPMLFKAMDQFLREVAWGELDYLLVDLPPGTGDIQLSLAQKIPLVGAVAVSTPQDVALTDVKKAIDMWTRTSVPMLGVIENMSWFVPPGSTERVQLFPKGSMETYLRERGIAKLGEVPFHPNVGIGGEAGIPIVESDPSSEEAQAFMAIARDLDQKLRGKAEHPLL
jgi:ATP-binding protein involved in chromosome partitioning